MSFLEQWKDANVSGCPVGDSHVVKDNFNAPQAAVGGKAQAQPLRSHSLKAASLDISKQSRQVQGASRDRVAAVTTGKPKVYFT